MATEKRGCTACGDLNIANPRTNLCSRCEKIFQEANRPNFIQKKNPGFKERGTSPGSPVNSLFDVANDVLGVAEHFGIDKKEVGKAVLKTAMTGKFDLFHDSPTKAKNKFERAISAVKEIAWIPLAYIVVYQLMNLLIHNFT